MATITGNAGNNYLLGTDGNDRIDGQAGADTMKGGYGNDTYVVDNFGDYIIDSRGTGIETVESSVTWFLGTGLDHLKLTGSDVIDGYGNDLNNRLEGNSADNSLVGYLGNDTLYGNGGNDTLNGYGYFDSNTSQIDELYGGSGYDTFVLGTAYGTFYVETGEGYGLIKDWDGARDSIQLHGHSGLYALEERNVVGGAGSANDTEIYYVANGQHERIGVVQNTTGLNLTSSSFSYM